MKNIIFHRGGSLFRVEALWHRFVLKERRASL